MKSVYSLKLYNLNTIIQHFFQELLEDQMNNFRKYGQFIVDKYMPPVAGSLKWTHQLRERITIPMTCFKSLQHP